MMVLRWIKCFLIILLLTGCAPSVTSQGKYAELGPKVTKLTKAVEAKVHYHQECTSTMTEKEVLYYSIAHDPQLLEPFASMKVRIEQQNGHAIVLICTSAGKAIHEDAGCTSTLDWSWKESETERNCEFTLTVCRNTMLMEKEK